MRRLCSVGSVNPRASLTVRTHPLGKRNVLRHRVLVRAEGDNRAKKQTDKITTEESHWVASWYKDFTRLIAFKYPHELPSLVVFSVNVVVCIMAIVLPWVLLVGVSYTAWLLYLWVGRHLGIEDSTRAEVVTIAVTVVAAVISYFGLIWNELKKLVRAQQSFQAKMTTLEFAVLERQKVSNINVYTNQAPAAPAATSSS